MLFRNAPTPRNPDAAGFRTSADRPAALLAQCPAYATTPMKDATSLAQKLGLNRLWIKDETARMNLGSFKALGGAFAVAQIILDRAGATDPMSGTAQEVARSLTFVTASAGNHGLSVAAGAKVFSANAKILLSSGVPDGFARRIRETGAEVIRVDGSYEDSVAEAIRLCDANGWVHLADGSWQGYTAQPALVMEGYSILAEECRRAFDEEGMWPTHVMLQAGVGGLAAATAAHIRRHWAVQPEIAIVEPEAAPCLLKSAEAGHLVRAPGPASNMGRLDCKDASLLAFETLRHDADTFVTVSDEDAAQAAKDLAGEGLATTPSGAAGLAALQTLALPSKARVMIIVSEGPEG